MKIKVAHKYVLLPIKKWSTSKKLKFFDGDNEVMRLESLGLDGFSPDYYAYVDISRFMGRELTLKVEPQMDFQVKFSDEMDIPELYSEERRPKAHFSPRVGYMDHPCGVAYLNGKYHLFFQHNPADTHLGFGNNHWGHATSTDLIHWEEGDAILFPDSAGGAMGGSVLIDERNELMLSDGGDAALIYYKRSNDGPINFAVSTDGFKTVELMPEPINSEFEGYCMCPKAIWCEELKKYLMTVFVHFGRHILLASDDLLSWSQLQIINMRGVSESADLFPITADDGKRKWVFMGRVTYYVGDMTEKGFCNTQDREILSIGSTNFGGQIVNTPDGRTVRLDNAKWYEYYATSFGGQLTTPVELSLRLVNGVYTIYAAPIREFASLFEEKRIESAFSVKANEPYTIKLEPKAHMIRICSDRPTEGKMVIRVFGMWLHIDFEEDEMHFGTDVLPISRSPYDTFDMTIITDRCSIEFYFHGGKRYAVYSDTYTISDYNLSSIIIDSTRDLHFGRVEITPLKSIWEDKK